MADRQGPIEGQSHWCEARNINGTKCQNIVRDDSDHCEAGHENAIRLKTISTIGVSDLTSEALVLGTDDLACPNCGYPVGPIPSEPPIGTWVRDRHGAVSVRNRDGWAPAPFGFYGAGQWAAMWQARGPLVECGPYGAEIAPESKISDLADKPSEPIVASTFPEIADDPWQELLEAACDVVADSSPAQGSWHPSLPMTPSIERLYNAVEAIDPSEGPISADSSADPWRCISLAEPNPACPWHGKHPCAKCGEEVWGDGHYVSSVGHLTDPGDAASPRWTCQQ
jgi:hypothetical protein